MKTHRIPVETLRMFALLLVECGVDLRKLRNFRNIPKFFFDLLKFVRSGGSIDSLTPQINDFNLNAGSGSGHYFHMDLIVAQHVYKRAPSRHVDIGSRIDGLVSHVACFRQIEVFDIRPLPSSGHPNIKFVQLDMSDVPNEFHGYTDSLSCLHALEHFGLGRYGDAIRPEGHINGFKSLIRMLKDDGLLYLGIPVSTAGNISFNAHRIFRLTEILQWCGDVQDFTLIETHLVNDRGELERNIDIRSYRRPIRHGCAIYVIKKNTKKGSDFL